MPDVRSSALLMFLKTFPPTTMSSSIPITPLYTSKVWSILARHFQPKGDTIESVSTERGVECGEVILLLVENKVPHLASTMERPVASVNLDIGFLLEWG